jgi:hypothetical protein
MISTKDGRLADTNGNATSSGFSVFFITGIMSLFITFGWMISVNQARPAERPKSARMNVPLERKLCRGIKTSRTSDARPQRKHESKAWLMLDRS